MGGNGNYDGLLQLTDDFSKNYKIHFFYIYSFFFLLNRDNYTVHIKFK